MVRDDLCCRHDGPILSGVCVRHYHDVVLSTRHAANGRIDAEVGRIPGNNKGLYGLIP